MTPKCASSASTAKAPAPRYSSANSVRLLLRILIPKLPFTVQARLRSSAPLQFLLPSTWTYDFIDSSHPCSAADELNGVYPGPYYCYFPKYTPEAMDEAVQYVQEVVEEDGPYDCVIGFSQVRLLRSTSRITNIE